MHATGILIAKVANMARPIAVTFTGATSTVLASDATFVYTVTSGSESSDDNASDPVAPTTLLTGAAYTGTISVIRLQTTLLSLASETATITYDVIGSSDSGGGSSAGGSSNDV